MVLEVRFHSTLRQYAPQGSAGVMMVHMPDGVTVEELLRELKVNLEEVKSLAINGVQSQIKDQTARALADGDRLEVFPA